MIPELVFIKEKTLTGDEIWINGHLYCHNSFTIIDESGLNSGHIALEAHFKSASFLPKEKVLRLDDDTYNENRQLVKRRFFAVGFIEAVEVGKSYINGVIDDEEAIHTLRFISNRNGDTLVFLLMCKELNTELAEIMQYSE